MKHLHEILSAATTEEELKHSFANFFKLPFSTRNRIDLYTEQILFEFKLDEPLKNLQSRAKVIAQALYYIRRLKFGDDDRAPSENICVATKNFAFVFPTETFAEFYNDKMIYDWDLKPSSPCKKLRAALEKFDAVIHAHVYDLSVIQEEIAFADWITNTRKRQYLLSNPKKEINQKNFYQVFQHWKNFFGEDVANGHKPSEYFLLDIEQKKSSFVADSNSVIFRMSGGDILEKLLNPDEYRHFWSTYEKICDAREIVAIRQKMDRITEVTLRRRTGEFYTPVDFARKAFDYLTRTVGEWWHDGNFRLWDMAAGTGNLEFAVPPEALQYCYVSTLIGDEADYCKKIFPDATVFQYDYLNDDESKLPANLRADLNNPEIKWIIFINPPYATAGNNKNKKNLIKGGVSMTAVRKQMFADNFGQSSQELSAQFLYRISRDFADRLAWLGIFSKIKYLNSSADQKFRDKCFSYRFERGFVFNSKNFDGCNADFPIGFLVWNLGEKLSLELQKISLSVYDAKVEKIAEKTIKLARSDKFLNVWAKRFRGIKKFPPMSSALKVSYGSKTPKDKVPKKFLATFMYSGNDFSNQNYTSFVSGSVARHGGMSVTPENFEQCMIVHMVRRLPKATWLNDRDQFMQPTKKLTPEFVSDAVIWSLFAPSNQTASLRDVEYEGEIYQIRNNFFPFTLAELKTWPCSSIEMVRRIDSAREDRFAALWIKNHRADLSSEAVEVLNAGREVYKKFFAQISTPDLPRWKISDWDAGWYQIRMALGATVDLSALSAKLEPQIYELGFLRDEVRYFDAE